jgi:hypothetical protein
MAVPRARILARPKSITVSSPLWDPYFAIHSPPSHPGVAPTASPLHERLASQPPAPLPSITSSLLGEISCGRLHSVLPCRQSRSASFFGGKILSIKGHTRCVFHIQAGQLLLPRAHDARPDTALTILWQGRRVGRGGDWQCCRRLERHFCDW